MARHIDVEKKIEEMNMYIESITKLIENRPYDEEAKLMLREYKYCLKELIDTPTADVEEVVRCRNCKHHHWEQEPCHGKTEHFCSVLKAQVFADFYCYHGAKMDGGKTE